MADDPTVLTPAQKEQILAWLRVRNAPRACTACGHNNWTLANHVVAPPTHHGGGLVIGGLTYPQIMLICKNCAHTVYFNAVIMGILTGDTPILSQSPPGGPPKTPSSNG